MATGHFTSMRAYASIAFMGLLTLAGCGQPSVSGPEPAAATDLAAARQELAELRKELEDLKARSAENDKRWADVQRALAETKSALQAPPDVKAAREIGDAQLSALLRSNDPELVRVAVTVIRRAPSDTRLQSMAELALDAQQALGSRHMVLDLMQGSDVQALAGPLAKLLDDPQPSMVAKAAAAISRSRDGKHLSALLKALKTLDRFADPGQRAEAERGLLAALGQLGDKQAAPALLEATHAENGDTKRTALQALRTLGDESIGPALLDAFQKLPPANNKEHPHLHLEYVYTLGHLKESRAAVTFINLLAAPHPALRSTALQYLPNLCGPDAMVALSSAIRGEWTAIRSGAKGDTNVLEVLIRSLSNAGNPQGLAVLLEALNQGMSGGPGREAAEALTALATPAYTLPMIETHGKTQSGEAKEALAKLLGGDAFPAKWDEAQKKFLPDGAPPAPPPPPTVAAPPAEEKGDKF